MKKNSFNHNSRLLLFGFAWYTFTAISNVYSKRFLDYGGTPLSLSFFSCSFGFIVYTLFYAKKSQRVYRMFLTNTPLSILHIGNVVFTFTSYQQSNVRFTYTIKAIEPLITALVCLTLYSEKMDVKLIVSLIPVPIGIFLASYSDINSSSSAKITALFSVIVSSARTVVFKHQGKSIIMEKTSKFQDDEFAQRPSETIKQVKRLNINFRSRLFWQFRLSG